MADPKLPSERILELSSDSLRRDGYRPGDNPSDLALTTHHIQGILDYLDEREGGSNGDHQAG